MSAFYLKYRPQSLDELIGQEAVKKIILGAFKNSKLSHAYLFVGPRGTGKTSTARILAKMVNCEGKGEVPCNKCATCLSITDGSNMDLIEIDAASNRGIEDIRALREKIKLSPSSARKKVYIIDEVHMLTTEAFNALLKTLEEPPEHALFILATTDAGKLPQTILSRVQRLDFKMASNSELLDTLKRIVKNEDLKIDEESLNLLVKKSDGSFRDGVKLLDQVSTMEEKITVQVLQKSLKSTSFNDILELIKSLSEKNITSAFSIIFKQQEAGVDTKETILSLMDIFRNIIFIKNGMGEQLVKSNYTEDKYEELIKISEKFSNQDLVRNLNVLQNSLEKLKFTSVPSLPLELAVVEICGEEKTNKMLENRDLKLDIEARSSDIENLSSTLQPQNPDSSIKRPASKPEEITISADIVKIKEKWTYVCETVRSSNFSLEALLRSVNVTECTDLEIFIEVPYSFHQRILEAPKNRDLLESIFSDILGRRIKVSTILGNRPRKLEDVQNVEVAKDDEIIRAAAEIFNSDSIN